MSSCMTANPSGQNETLHKEMSSCGGRWAGGLPSAMAIEKIIKNGELTIVV